MVDGPRRPLRVIHTSDLHLALMGDRACDGLVAVVDMALEVKANLLVIVGDLFDHNRVEDRLISFAVEQLKRLPIDVVVLPGNHDCLVPGSVFRKAQFWQSATNVRIIEKEGGETLVLPHIGVAVWGKPIASYEGDIRPLDVVPQPEKNGYWHLGLAHGYYVDGENSSFRSYLISHQEIADSHQDYIALGHYPVFRCVCESPLAYYCDSPSLAGTVSIIDFSEEAGVRVTKKPLPLPDVHIDSIV